MSRFDICVKTFLRRGWDVVYLPSIRMAQAGFHYTGERDLVKCCFCDIELDNWTPDDEPHARHLALSPDCPFFKLRGEFFIDSDENDLKYGKESTDINVTLESYGIIQKVTLASKKKFARLDSRMATYTKCEIEINQDPLLIGEAGFYYIGGGRTDTVNCFCCDGHLGCWQYNEDPWKQHAEWFPGCCFLLLSKGKHFVDQVRHEVSERKNMKSIPSLPKLNQELLTKMISTENHGANPEQMVKIILTKRKFTDQYESNAKKTSSAIQPKSNGSYSCKNNDESDHVRVLCKICYINEVKVAIIPCGHIVSCVSCTLVMNECAMCRKTYDKVITINLIDDVMITDPCTSKSLRQTSTQPMICKVCYKRERGAVFIPCNHVIACVKCAEEAHECTICGESVIAFMQVYL